MSAIIPLPPTGPLDHSQGTSWLNYSVNTRARGREDSLTKIRCWTSKCPQKQQCAAVTEVDWDALRFVASLSPNILVLNKMTHLFIKVSYIGDSDREGNKIWQNINKMYSTLFLANSFSKLHFSCAISFSVLLTCQKKEEERNGSIIKQWTGSTIADIPCMPINTYTAEIPHLSSQERGPSGSLWGRADFTNSPKIRKTCLYIRVCWYLPN